MSKLDHMLEPEATAVRRLEIISGTGRRRRFSADDKARVVEESLAPGTVISEVARRNGLTPQQLFSWRREARERTGMSSAVCFAPVVMAALPVADTETAAATIEVVIGAITVRILPGTDAAMLRLVLRAVQATS
jgi:transposase